MKSIQTIIGLAVIGLVAGVVIGEWFPRLFDSGVTNAFGSALQGPFSDYRNELAMKYGLFGAGIGAAIGVGLAFILKKK